MSETDAAPDAARSHEIDRLRRTAFGRTSSAADETVARAALVELARIEAEEAVRAEQAAQAEQSALSAARAAETARLATASAEEPVEPSRAEPAEATHDGAPPRWRRWLAPAAAGAVVGALVVGGIVFAVPPGAPDVPSATNGAGAPRDLNYFLGDPSGDGGSTDGTIAGMTPKGGDLRAAERWFAEPQTADDLADVGTLLPEYDRSSVRLVHAGPVARVWVAKRVDGQLCLEVTVQQTDYSVGSCALPPDFSARGLTVSNDAATVRWNGGQVSVLLSPPPAP